MESLRANLIVGRARARLSQAELAERSGVSRPTISRIERCAAGDVGIDVIQRLANALGSTVADLFVPASTAPVDDDELARRASTPDSEFIAAGDLLDAIAEASGEDLPRYSRAGRPVGR
ncbi:MAG TPA: helix-turn-helix transcriptional regulator [Verrucomicrobiae bacterium]|nr:helix-turn-helix transcriptional regulator [Verrucomicrobiae bacterium]